MVGLWVLGVINLSVGICDGAPSTVRLSYCKFSSDVWGARKSTVAGPIISPDFSEASLSKYLVFKTEYFWVKQD